MSKHATVGWIIGLTLVLAGVASAENWSPPLSLDGVQLYGDTGAIIVYTRGGAAYHPGCEIDKWEIVGKSPVGKARLLDGLLVALANGKKVAFWWNDRCGVWSYHKADAIYVSATGTEKPPR